MGSASELRAAADRADTKAEQIADVSTELDVLVDGLRALNCRGLSAEARRALAAAVESFRAAKKAVARDHRAAEKEAERLSDVASEAELDEMGEEEVDAAA
jgi:hypothetical protein